MTVAQDLRCHTTSIELRSRAAINSFMFLANPQNKLPSAKTVKAKVTHDLRPKMSPIFPYSGLTIKS